MSSTLASIPRDPMPDASAIEAAVVQGDLSRLTPAQRVTFYHKFCNSVGLNPLTGPMAYIVLNGKLTLYAKKDAADQLRRLHNISIDKPEITFQDDFIVVSVLARTAEGRTDADVGVVSKKDMRGDFANSLMKAITKAKRRVTLSICGLGVLDETEVESIPDAQHVTVNTETGEIASVTSTNGFKLSSSAQGPEASPSPAPASSGSITEAQRKRLFAIAKEAGWQNAELRNHLQVTYGVEHTKDIPRDRYDEIIADLQGGVGDVPAQAADDSEPV